uniref:Uncharacterized protein n=1 Tax=Alexandrium catenella TaxID=2925 RepID=A0A7S1PNJ8_ALECA
MLYLTRLARAEPRPGSEFHLADLYCWAAFERLCPLAGHAALGRALAQWWPVWGFACGLLLSPGAGVPFQHPSELLLPRARFYLVEAVLALAFTTVPRAGPRGTHPIPDSLRARLPWLGSWALFAFCSHKALLVLLPAPWALLAVSAPALLALAAPAPGARCPEGALGA